MYICCEENINLISFVFIWCFLCLLYDHFFFQAEDGIRDLYVTGVQTCALPICALVDADKSFLAGQRAMATKDYATAEKELTAALASGPDAWLRRPEVIYYLQNTKQRSEERRVGEECRLRWWVYGG